MATSNPPNDWLKELSDTLWQIRMVSQETGGIFNSVVDTGLKLIQKIQALIAATNALVAINARIASGDLQRSLHRGIVSGFRSASRGATRASHALYRRAASAAPGSTFGRVAGTGARLLSRAGGMLTRGGMAVAGASTGAIASAAAATGGIALAGIAAWKALKTGFSIWSREHQENLENSRKRASAAAGAQARRAQLNNRLGTEIESEAVKNVYAIEQKRAENAKALHLMKSTSVAKELEYQREIFAIEERRFENEKKIAALRTRMNQVSQRTNAAIEEVEKKGTAMDSARIVRRWYWADKTVDANGNKIGNDLARGAGLRTFLRKSTVDANFAALQEIARNVRANIISGFREGSDIFSAKLNAVMDKLSALGTDGYSEALGRQFSALQARIADIQQRRADNMYAINYDKMMRMSEYDAMQAGLLSRDKDGNYVFMDEDGDSRIMTATEFRKKKKEHLEDHPDGYAKVDMLDADLQQAQKDLDILSAKIEMAGHIQGVANERMKKEAETRKQISEKQREKYISNTAETVNQFTASNASLERQVGTRARSLHQEYALALVQDDAEATQKMKEEFALSNAEKDVRDKSAEKFENEGRELENRHRVEAAKRTLESSLEMSRQMRRFGESLQKARLSITESQAELARKINKFQLDIELANADTYGKTVWEVQKAIQQSFIDQQHAQKLQNINEKYTMREMKENDALDTEKTAEVESLKDEHLDARQKLEKDQFEQRKQLEKELIDAQLEYRKAEIRYEYAYREKMEEEFNQRRENDRKAWLQGVTKEEVKNLIGVDKKVEELTEEEQTRLAKTRKAKAERAKDVDSLQKEFGVEGQDKEAFTKTLDQIINQYETTEKNLDQVKTNITNTRAKIKEKVEQDFAEKYKAEESEKMKAEGLNPDSIKGQVELTRRVQRRLMNNTELNEEIKNKTDDFVKRTYGDVVQYNNETQEVTLNTQKYAKAKETKDMLQWETEHSGEIEKARKSEKINADEFKKTQKAIEEEAAAEAGLTDALNTRKDAAEKQADLQSQQAEEQARLENKQTDEKEELDQRYRQRANEEESRRKIERANEEGQEDLKHTATSRRKDIFLENRARYDKFSAQQADIYNRGQIAQRNLATDTLISAMQQNGGGYTNQMIKYGIQSEYESAKNEMEARHAAEKEQLESRGNVTEYERQELQNRQAMEASDLDNDKKLRDMMADRVMNANVGQKSGLAETWERIQASAFGHMKDPVEMAIDSLKENDSKNHDDLMSRLDQYLPAIAQNTAETDATAVSTVTNYLSPNQNAQGLLAGMPNVRMQ